MRRLHTTVGAGVLLLAATACAEQQPDVGFGGKPPTSSSIEQRPPASVRPNPPEGRSNVPAKQIDATALPKSYPREVWTQHDGTVVAATGQEGGCGSVHAELTEQTAKKVGIVFIEEIPKAADACTMDIRYRPVTVELDAPLDTRTVVLEQRQVKVPSE
ncbi:hypothetical protein DFQ14_105147 [Halopolyspora algeriensis]|uniref:Lipoprotein n=1 Tax=Halopolyspora algeriensis TaxID=1500506 RepID=A0A368VSP4_9ACTN|nr:hypothetical protein [Halopolyspora algeriensis]RCW44002.1 hypothetical protein DFQ14_105147 [Halopolyspora algeriensis]TQM53495.1 hypothetical protein FHU43_1651 [Halopolyspora algeriensis]